MFRRKFTFEQKKKTVLLSGLTVFVMVIALLMLSEKTYQRPLLGVTFSRIYAEQLGLNWRDAYSGMMNDLDIDHMRLPVYWDDIERDQGQFTFDDYDWMLDLASEHDVKVTLAIGQKVPRWPECFTPDWVDRYGGEARQGYVLNMIEQVVNRYKGHPSVIRWQVENEAFLQFGRCPEPDLVFFSNEINLVRSLDDKPISMTTSGEVEPWFHTIPFADHVGFSLYRLTWNSVFGFWMYPLQPSFYIGRMKAIEPFTDQVYVSELQGEPWFHKPVTELSIGEQHQMFSPRMLRENVRFAKRINSPMVDLWGVEWWYFMKVNGDESLWEEAQKIFNEY